MKSRSVLESFRFAMEGLVYALKTHAHMRYMLIISAVVLVASQFLGVDRIGLLALIFTTGALFVVELLNASIEAAVDLACDSFHPLAKVAKDVAGAAVMVASAAAIFVGALVLLESPRVTYFFGLSAKQPEPKALHVALVGAVVMVITVVLGKVWGGKGTILRGGAISGHAALAGYFLATITYKAGSALIFGLAFGLAFLVAQSRVEAEIHSLREVLLGSLVGLGFSSALLIVLT